MKRTIKQLMTAILAVAMLLGLVSLTACQGASDPGDGQGSTGTGTAAIEGIYVSKVSPVSYDVDGTEYTFHPSWTLTTYADGTYMFIYGCEMTFGMSAGTEVRTSFGKFTKELTDPDESDMQYTYSLAKPDRIMLNDGYAWGTFEHLDTEGNDYDSVVASINGNANASWFWWTADDTVKVYIDDSTHEVIGAMGDNSPMNG